MFMYFENFVKYTFSKVKNVFFLAINNIKKKLVLNGSCGIVIATQ